MKVKEKEEFPGRKTHLLRFTRHFLFAIPGKSLLREWCKYRYGVFPERGSPGGDARLYPHLYPEGNRTIVSQGCGKGEEGEELPFCPLGMPYNRYGEQKQCISLLYVDPQLIFFF